MDKDGNSETHTITITVDHKGDFTYENPLIWVYPGDKIIWECKNSCPFAIHIGWSSPVKGRYHSVDGEPIEASVKNNAQFGHYSYTVAVCVDNVIWTDDPPFIVRPPRH